MRNIYPPELGIEEVTHFEDIVHELVGEIQPRIDKLELFGGLTFECLSTEVYFV